MKKAFLLGSILAWCVSSAPLHCASNPGEAGSKFLLIPASARPGALEGAYTACRGNVSCFDNNPAGLAHLEEYQFLASHSVYPGKVNFTTASLASRTYKGIGGMFRFRMLYVNDVQRDGIGQRIGDSNIPVRDGGYTLGLNFLLSPRWSAGLAAEYVTRTLHIYKDTTFAFHGGLQFNSKNKKHVLGVSIQNYGEGVKFFQEKDPLPTVYRLGGGHHVREKYELFWEIDKYKDNPSLSPALGLEWKIFPYFSIRGGISSNRSIHGSAGMGFDLENYALDYAVRPQEAIGIVHQISLTFKWDADGHEFDF